MSYSSENGYVPESIDTIMESVMENINAQFGESYDYGSFVGTNFYKYFYALVQKLQENEVKTSEIFLKLQGYFTITNEKVQRPVVTYPGIVSYLKTNGFTASVKPPIDADAGKLYVAVILDNGDPDFAADKLEVNTLLSQVVVAGVITQGDQVSSILLSNGQSFDFKFKLPVSYATKLRLTTTISPNSGYAVPTGEEIRALILANVRAKYNIGMNFEPQRYFTIVDAPWASSILLEWSNDNGVTWYSSIYVSNYDEFFNVQLENISVV